jgi:hypothetical protein
MTDTTNKLGLRHNSHFERTGKLGPKIDVYFVADTKAPSRSLVYKHSTQWHRTCKEAIASASRLYGLPTDCLRAHKA